MAWNTLCILSLLVQFTCLIRFEWNELLAKTHTHTQNGITRKHKKDQITTFHIYCKRIVFNFCISRHWNEELFDNFSGNICHEIAGWHHVHSAKRVHSIEIEKRNQIPCTQYGILGFMVLICFVSHDFRQINQKKQFQKNYQIREHFFFSFRCFFSCLYKNESAIRDRVISCTLLKRWGPNSTHTQLHSDELTVRSAHTHNLQSIIDWQLQNWFTRKFLVVQATSCSQHIPKCIICCFRWIRFDSSLKSIEKAIEKGFHKA